MESPLVRAHAVSKAYGSGETRIQALDGVSLELSAGRLYTLAGPSGSGKSTLLHVIGGMDRPDAGEVQVNGFALHRLTTGELAVFRRRQVGFVFQAFNLIPNLTALENVMLPAAFARTPSAAARERAATLLDRVGLAARMQHRPGQLSGGEQQRVAIARALVNRPALILADEPTGNLDTRTGGAIIDLLASLAGEHTVLIATHDQRIARIASRELAMEDGAIAGE